MTAQLPLIWSGVLGYREKESEGLLPLVDVMVRRLGALPVSCRGPSVHCPPSYPGARSCPPTPRHVVLVLFIFVAPVAGHGSFVLVACPSKTTPAKVGGSSAYSGPRRHDAGLASLAHPPFPTPSDGGRLGMAYPVKLMKGGVQTALALVAV